MPFRREGTCNDCGDCCGANGECPFPINGWEVIRNWDTTSINISYPHYKLLGLGDVGGGVIGIIENEGHIQIRGTKYYWTWQETSKGGHVPMKDTSAAHDGSSYLPECLLLEDDPGDGSRPCAIAGTQYDNVRAQFCRPEERDDYVAADDIWNDRSKEQWENDHPNCSYTWVSV